MIDLWDANARALIAFSLVMITGLLAYIAFNLPKKGHHHSSRK